MLSPIRFASSGKPEADAAHLISIPPGLLDFPNTAKLRTSAHNASNFLNQFHSSLNHIRTKIQTFTGKQDSSIQMHPETDLDIWNPALGMY
jgi:hypothetical protein